MMSIFGKQKAKDREIAVMKLSDELKKECMEEVELRDKQKLTVIKADKFNKILTVSWNEGRKELEKHMEVCGITDCKRKADVLTVEGYPLCDKHYESYRFSWRIKCPECNRNDLKVELKQLRLIEQCPNCNWKSGGN